MTNRERILINYVCHGDLKRAQMQARTNLINLQTQKDAYFKTEMLALLDKKDNFELPQALQGLLTIIDSAKFPVEKFLLRETEQAVAEEAITLYQVGAELAERGIPFLPALMLYGDSGCGKTALAQYIAYKAGLPCVLVRFSNVVEALLGKTQSNIAKIFDFVREHPCVLCFDEIDAIGLKRGQDHDSGEISRVTIAIMQEMDQMPNNVIIIGTTNRFDRLDPALVRRFPLQREILPLAPDEAREMAHRFLEYAKIAAPETWYIETFTEPVPASRVVKICTDFAVAHILSERV